MNKKEYITNMLVNVYQVPTNDLDELTLNELEELLFKKQKTNLNIAKKKSKFSTINTFLNVKKEKKNYSYSGIGIFLTILFFASSIFIIFILLILDVF